MGLNQQVRLQKATSKKKKSTKNRGKPTTTTRTDVENRENHLLYRQNTNRNSKRTNAGSNWSTQSANMFKTSAQLEAANQTNYEKRQFRTLDFEAGMKSIIQQEQEVRALQRALNLPQAPVLPTSLMRPTDMPPLNNFLSSSTHQTRIVTETDLKTKTDSLYMYNLENPMHKSVNHTEQSYHDFHRTLDRVGAPIKASSSAQVPRGAYDTDHHHHTDGEELFFKSSKLDSSHLWNPRKTTSIGTDWDELYNTKTRDCLTESCTGSRGASVLDKVREAQLVIEHQNEVIAKAENRVSSLQGELKKMGMDKQIYEEEIMTLKKEKEYFDGITSRGTKKRQEVLTRLNELDQDFRELNIAHNALLVESKKKEADLLQAELRLNNLEESNNKLQQANKKLLNEQKVAQQQINQLLSDQKIFQTEKQQAKGETAIVIQENKRLTNEITTLKTKCTGLNTHLWGQNTSHRKLMQELEELQMAYELRCNRVGLLEEEVKQQQETFELLNKEQEQSQKRNIEQICRSKEALYLDKIRKLTEAKDLLQRRCQDLLHKNMQIENGAENAGFQKHGAVTATTEIETVSSLKRQIDQLMIENSDLAVKVHDVERLREELSRSHDEQTRLSEQLQSLHKDHTRTLNENKSLKDQLDYSQNVQAQLEKGIQDLSSSNEVLYSEVVNLKQNENKIQSITALQENLQQIKKKIMSLETEKCDLTSSLQELQNDRHSWSKEKKELMLSLAELDAENSKMKDHLKAAKNQVSSEALSDEFQIIKQELDKVHKMLRLKDEELETQAKKVSFLSQQTDEDQQLLNKINEFFKRGENLNRFNEENAQLKKSFADIASKTSARNLVISTLRDQLEEQIQRINELEHELNSKNHQFEELNTRHSKMEIELCQPSPKAMRWVSRQRNVLEAERDLYKIQVFELKSRLNGCESKNVVEEEILSLESLNADLSVRRKSDGCLTRRNITEHVRLSKHDDTLRALKKENSKLKVRLDELVMERNSVLQDSEDLMEGMQQLKEAFEDEIERRLEKQHCEND